MNSGLEVLGRSRLNSVGDPESHPESKAWADKVTQHLLEQLNGPIEATLWPYRLCGKEHLACEISDAQGNDYSITFTIGEELNCSFNPQGCDPWVPDMSEALHMAGMVLTAVGAQVTVGRGAPRSTPR